MPLKGLLLKSAVTAREPPSPREMACQVPPRPLHSEKPSDNPPMTRPAVYLSVSATRSVRVLGNGKRQVTSQVHVLWSPVSFKTKKSSS